MFLVVDNVVTPATAASSSSAPAAASSSIFDITSVSFEGGKLRMTSYMESFPVPYFIVLRDMASLPETLGDTLCQWFDMVKTSEL